MQISCRRISLSLHRKLQCNIETGRWLKSSNGSAGQIWGGTAISSSADHTNSSEDRWKIHLDLSELLQDGGATYFGVKVEVWLQRRVSLYCSSYLSQLQWRIQQILTPLEGAILQFYNCSQRKHRRNSIRPVIHIPGLSSRLESGSQAIQEFQLSFESGESDQWDANMCIVTCSWDSTRPLVLYKL